MIPFPFQAAQFGRGGADGDPYWSSVVALLHMDGTNGSTTFTDQKGKTFTANGNAQISTAQSKFGGASGLFDASGDYLSTSDSEDFNLSGNFTIEAWVYASNTISANRRVLSQQKNSPLSYMFFRATSAGKLSLGVSTSSAINLVGTTTITASAWHHVAATRSGNDWRIFLDGNLEASTTNSGTYPNVPHVFTVGALDDSSNPTSEFWDGYIDEVRITKGVARYTATFTPPSTPFQNS